MTVGSAFYLCLVFVILMAIARGLVLAIRSRHRLGKRATNVAYGCVALLLAWLALAIFPLFYIFERAIVGTTMVTEYPVVRLAAVAPFLILHAIGYLLIISEALKKGVEVSEV